MGHIGVAHVGGRSAEACRVLEWGGQAFEWVQSKERKHGVDFICIQGLERIQRRVKNRLWGLIRRPIRSY